GLHTRAWELGLGALLAVTLTTTRRAPENLRAGLGWIGLVAIGIAIATFDRVEHFPGTWAALPVIGAALVLISGDDNPRGVARLLRLSPLQWAGSRSYSLYLWHWPALVIGAAAIGREPGPLATVALVATSIALAEIGFRLIENPIRRSPRLARRSGLSLTVGAGLLAVGAVVGLAVSNVDTTTRTGVIAAAPEPAPALPEVTDVPPPTSADAIALDAIADALGARVVPDNLRPSLLEANRDTSPLYGTGCHQYLEERAAQGCVFGDPDGDITVAIWGDSHAAQWFSAIDLIAEQRGWRLVSITQGGCPVIDVLTWNRSGDAVFDHCAPWRDNVLDRFAEEEVDVVLLGQHYGLLDADSRGAVNASVWAEQLPALLDRVSETMTPIVLIDSPDPPEDVPTCLSEHPEEIEVCEPGAPGNTEAAVAATIREITAERGVGTIDPRPWLCVDDRCPVVVGDILVYRDSHHLSDTFVRWFTPVLDRAIGPYIDSLR
ncbi:MAG: acyltransferase, partial [Actinobacteria bacterium]|nr:acyltransferase [Actinomycetota bacterium]